jgi:hypothetical protein
MSDPDQDKTPEQLNAMAAMAAYDRLPEGIRDAIACCPFKVSPFRVAMLLAWQRQVDVAQAIEAIASEADLVAFHGVDPRIVAERRQNGAH